MPRPQTKVDLIKFSNENFEKLMCLVDGMTDNQMKISFDFMLDSKKKEAHWKRDKNVRDVFIHLIRWHNLLIDWVNNNQNGKRTQFLMEGYNWKTYGDMNMVFWKEGQSTSFEKSKKELAISHKTVMEIISSMSNEQLFTRGYFSWTGDNALGAYLVSVTSSHYDWAIKKIKAHIKNTNDK